MALRALLFDLDDTLVPEAPAIVAGYAAVAERVWGAATPDRIHQLTESARAVWRAGAPAAYRERVHFSLEEGLHGEFVADGPEADALRAFVPHLHAEAFEAVLPAARRGSSAELVGQWRAARMAAVAPYPETREVLRALADRMPLALVTNGAVRLQHEKLVRAGIEQRFAAVVVSEAVGAGKPSPVMFEVALQRLGIGRDKVAMVGNDVSRDVAGARGARIRPIWVRRPGDGWEHEDPGDADRVPDLHELLTLLDREAAEPAAARG